ncbi:MAG: 1-acyl-sn-glycerol-3-phosphate acyltransferase [Armatimonadetes bacterium]|nr:1-acyl-sn-glycerol-3-phosphate acyltransferase [Armatimonadota bacterium]
MSTPTTAASGQTPGQIAPARTAGTDFRPARLHPPTLRLFWAALPLLLRRFCDVVRVDIPPEDIARLKSLAGERLLLTPNHPTNDDPALLFALSQAANVPFHYLACRETFDGLGGLWGRLIQRLGAYSVVRGTADRESFRATRELLAGPAGKVVIFPEGEVYSQNDTLLPFHSGVVQLAFWALEDARRAGDEQADVSLLPVAVRYCFVQDMTEPIARSLASLEEALGLVTEAGAEPYARLRRIGIAVLETMEAEYGLKRRGPGAEDLTPRMNALKTLLLDRAAALIGVTLPPDATLPEKMRTLINSVYAVTREEPAARRSPYRERLHAQQAACVEPLMRDLNRVANWIAVQDNYVRARPTPERMADNLRRLEVEAFGAPRLRGPRRATVRVGDPFRLAPCYDAYRADKRATAARVTRDLEAAVQALLDASAAA